MIESLKELQKMESELLKALAKAKMN